MSSNIQPSQLEGAVPSAPGILFVLSTVLDPDVLEPASFTDWYERTHIQEVQRTAGISSTQRYESLAFSSSYRHLSFPTLPKNRNLAFDFATVYQMPELAFRETPAFRGLDGQSAPREELLEGLFRHVGFVTRFAERVSMVPASAAGEVGTPPFVVTLAPAPDAELQEKLQRLPSLSRLSVYKVHEGSLLERFERSWLSEPSSMAVLEFEGSQGLAAAAEVVGEGERLEVGFWMLRRAYDGSERTPTEWKPSGRA